VFLETGQRRLHVKLENYFTGLFARAKEILAKYRWSKVKAQVIFKFHLKISKSP